MHNRQPDHGPHPNDAGFTLGEAMISLVLTLVVVTGAIETLTRSITLTGTSRVMSETNHGLQAAMSLMVRDIMQTGQGIPLGGIPIPNGAGALAVFRPGPVGGMTFGVGTDSVSALTPGNAAGPTIGANQTDIITIMYVDRVLNLAANPLTAIAADGSTMTVNGATPVTGVGGLVAGDLILFSNALGNAIQMVTQTPTSQTVVFANNASDLMRINQRGAPEGTLLQLQSSPGVFPPTTAQRIVMISYYIDTTTDPNLPRLVRRVNMGNTLAIALGIENVQLTYDLVDGVTNPTNVNTPGAGNNADQIRKVSIVLSARSKEPNPQTNQFFRNQMATEVGLRSLSFVDRYQ
jgi:hypothetical protein